jgi:hypothetical protein
MCASGFSHNLAAPPPNNVIGPSIARAEEQANCTHQQKDVTQHCLRGTRLCALLASYAIALYAQGWLKNYMPQNSGFLYPKKALDF